MKSIAVIGTSYVGLTTGACFADLGNQVVCVDVDAAKIAGLQEGVLPIHEPGLGEVVVRNARAGRLAFTTSYAEALADAAFVFIAVGTPDGGNGGADLSQLLQAVMDINRDRRQWVLDVLHDRATRERPNHDAGNEIAEKGWLSEALGDETTQSCGTP